MFVGITTRGKMMKMLNDGDLNPQQVKLILQNSILTVQFKQVITGVSPFIEHIIQCFNHSITFNCSFLHVGAKILWCSWCVL